MSVNPERRAGSTRRPTDGGDRLGQRRARGRRSSTRRACELERFTVEHTAAGLRRLLRRLPARRRRRGRDRTSGRPGRRRAAGRRPDRVRDRPEPAEEPARPLRLGREQGRPFDAFVLADTVRTDRARLRPLTPDSAATVTLRMTVRARQDLVATRVALANQLRAHLQTTLPGAIGLFRDIDSADHACAFLTPLPQPGQGRLALPDPAGELAARRRLQPPRATLDRLCTPTCAGAARGTTGPQARGPSPDHPGPGRRAHAPLRRPDRAPSRPRSPSSSPRTPTPRSSPRCPAPAPSAPPGCSPRSATPAAASPPPNR